MTALFLLSAAVQWNDPDPVVWMGIYGLAAALSGAAAAGRLPLGPNLGAAILFLVLTALWAPSLLGARGAAFTSFHMQAARDEEPRETVGLAICAGWSLAQSALAWRTRKR